MEAYIPRVEPEVEPPVRVYYPGDAPLFMGNNVPLYLEWIVEGPGGDLYVVPAETRGWHRRIPYDGPRTNLRQVSPRKASTILRLLCDENVASVA